jgi:hypothetical protein
MSSDELQQKLNSAKNQREQEVKLPIDPRELAERKKYHAIYNRIYPMLMKSTFDFSEVADVAGVKERRMKEALLSRLALDDMVQLIGCKPGSCYLCGTRIPGCYIGEPFCMFCLRSIEAAINSLYPVEPPAKSASAKLKNMKSQPANTILDDLLACGAPLMAVTGDPLHTRPEVLNILDTAEDPAEALDEVERFLRSERLTIVKASSNTNLRRFGFQRVKPRN